MVADDRQKPAKAKISLPSFREVQAAQKPKPVVNLFQSRSPSSSAPSGGPPAGPSFVPAANQATAFQALRPAQPTPTAFNTNAVSQGGAGPSAMPNVPSSSMAGPSSRGSVGPPSTSYPVAYAAAGGLVDYQAHNASPNAILVSKRQEGNPLLKHIKNVRWHFADIVPDYIMGADTCGLFLSMRFHLLKPEYIHHRIKELQRSFRLRVLMCHIDVDDVIEPLQQITRAALLNDVTLICGWSPEECARYLETYKVYETKPADAILGRTDEDYLSRLNAAFTTVRGVNKTDVLTLGSTFQTAARVMQASMEELSACPGIGPTKVRRLYDTFHEPFRKTLQQQNAAAVSSEARQAVVAQAASPSPAAQATPLDDLHAEDDSEADSEELL